MFCIDVDYEECMNMDCKCYDCEEAQHDKEEDDCPFCYKYGCPKDNIKENI